MTAAPEQPDDSYPSSWRPREAIARDEAVEPLAAEVWLASLDEQELTQLLQRVRGMRR